ncbi:MAG TPA: penicillin acylase family protein [Solirubrobacteraceae bacterium]
MRLTLLAILVALLIPAAAAAEDDYDVTIQRTDHGIPHITAKDYGSLGYGYGYALAEDNLCVIADQYVTVRGERSKYFGPDATWSMRSNGTTQTNLNSDFFYKKIIVQQTIEKLLAQEPPNGPKPEIREAVRGYVAGYNRYLRDVGVANLPDAACRGAEWVKPIEEIDAYRRFYQLALLASSGVAINGIGGAEPPTPAMGGGGVPVPTPEQLATLKEQLPLGGIGSNAYGIGKDQTDNGKGMLLGNPHFPWDGSERFYQAHATIPGKMDVSGGSLFGVPVVLIGHTRGLAWSHTVSTAYRFTPFELKLVPGSPTTYLVDGQPKQMTPTEVTVDVKTDSGIEQQKRVLWDTEYGPVFTEILGLPLFPWTPAVAFAMGDANAANFRYLNHFFETNHAQSVREYDQVLRRNQGIPWVNSIAADSSGEAYYADISVVPHVTNEQADACNTEVGRATYGALRLPTLDGSRSECKWGNDPSAVQPGTFGPDEHLPSMFRPDYVMNSNDSYWLGNLKHPLEGFPLIVGDERTERTLRTRLGLLMVDGETFSLRKLQDTVFNNRQYTGELWMPEVRSLCESDSSLAEPCAALAKWDVHDDLGSQGALLFRRFAQRLLSGPTGVADPPPPWRNSFDANDPARTPNGLDTDDPRVKQALQDATDELKGLGIPLDAPLGDVQAEVREGERIPIHGGPGTAGVFNAINVGAPGEGGIKNVPHGSSFVQAVQFVDGPCPVEPRTILTYSQSTNKASPWFSDQTRMFSRKEWVDTPFCAPDVQRETIATTELRSSDRPGPPPEQCRSPAGFRRVSARSRGRRGVTFRWETRAGGPVRVDVFRLTRGSRMLRRPRRVARFTAKESLSGANFNGRRLRGAGVFVARFRARGAFGGTDTRRLAFRRTRSGRFRPLPKFEANSGCGLVRAFRLSAPVFGRRGVVASFRVAEDARFTLFHGRETASKVSSGIAEGTVKAGQTRRLRLRPTVRGTYPFRLEIEAGGRTVTVTLRARRM